MAVGNEEINLSDTITPVAPDSDPFWDVWTDLVSSGISRVSYGLVSLGEDNYMAVLPELEVGMDPLETLKALMKQNFKVGPPSKPSSWSMTNPSNLRTKSFIWKENQSKSDLNYSEAVLTGDWKITLMLWYNPSAPSCYVVYGLGDETKGVPLSIYKKAPDVVLQEIIKTQDKIKPFKLKSIDGMAVVNTSVRTIYFLSKDRTHRDSINKMVVGSD
jgi:hypothetical protein